MWGENEESMIQFRTFYDIFGHLVDMLGSNPDHQLLSFETLFDNNCETKEF